MIVGVPKEIKNNEFRVGLTPKSVDEITSIGHDVYVENNAGFEIGYTNQNYIESGAKIINSAEEALNEATLPFVIDIANKGLDKSLNEDINLFNGLNLKDNEIVHKSVRESFNL